MPEPPVTRATLLVRIRDANDTQAWRQFSELYAPVVYGLFRRRGLQDADAADLTQEVLQAVAVGAERFEYDPQRGTFRGWLYRIARNKLNDFLAHQMRHPRGNGAKTTQDLINSLPAAEEEAAQWDREYEHRVFIWAAEHVRACVDESTWQAFWQTAVEGKSGRDVAEAVGLSVGAVYVAKSRVLARLKQQVEHIQAEYEGDGSWSR
jgi:RNA polymerase sigma-70 factor (ECF subfamily)